MPGMPPAARKLVAAIEAFKSEQKENLPEPIEQAIEGLKGSLTEIMPSYDSPGMKEAYGDYSKEVDKKKKSIKEPVSPGMEAANEAQGLKTEVDSDRVQEAIKVLQGER